MNTKRYYMSCTDINFRSFCKLLVYFVYKYIDKKSSKTRKINIHDIPKIPIIYYKNNNKTLLYELYGY